MDYIPNLRPDTINQNLKHMEFPWPSMVVSRANEIKADLKQGKKYPFKEVFHVHAADQQAMGQKPITFIQKTVALCIDQSLLQSDDYPSDAKQRALTFLKSSNGKTTGSYSFAWGNVEVRKQAATFLQQRDGVPSNYEDIILTSGATEAMRELLYLLSNKDSDKPPGVMIPIPQYPLFSCTATEYGMYQIKYYLNEDDDWSLDVSELRRAIKDSRLYCKPKVLVVINPGNPSGFVLSKADIQNIIKFAYEENLLIVADEVYQYNVYDPDLEFLSFKKVMFEMGHPYDKMELASVMSGSKGFMGECGARSGCCEIVNVDHEIKELLVTLSQIKLSQSVIGQVVMYCITNPPQPDEPSYKLYEMEKNSVMNSLKERAQFCYVKLSGVPGLSCNRVMGAMFVFPRIYISRKAVEQAQTRNMTPDQFYSMEMLENYGVCVLPGSLFGQRPGTYHFRLSFLSKMNTLMEVIEKVLCFHRSFMEKYKD